MREGFGFVNMNYQVGMQNSSLGVVLATTHFSLAMVALPPAMYVVVMNMMGNTLGSLWRNMEPFDAPKATIAATQSYF